MVREELWRRVNRPHGSLSLKRVLEGVEAFSSEFNGVLVSETMLLDKVEYGGGLEEVAGFLKGLKHLSKAYIAVPTRPPAEPWAGPPGEAVVAAAYHVFSHVLGKERVELLTSLEPPGFAALGEPRTAILAVASVHPIRRDAMERLLEEYGVDWRLVGELVAAGELVEVEYRGTMYYVRRLPGR